MFDWAGGMFSVSCIPVFKILPVQAVFCSLKYAVKNVSNLMFSIAVCLASEMRKITCYKTA